MASVNVPIVVNLTLTVDPIGQGVTIKQQEPSKEDVEHGQYFLAKRRLGYQLIGKCFQCSNAKLWTTGLRGMKSIYKCQELADRLYYPDENHEPLEVLEDFGCARFRDDCRG